MPVPTPSATIDAAPAVATADLVNLDGVFESLLHGNDAVEVTVLRDGRAMYARAGGLTLDGAPATTATPLVLASVSKLVTALTVARLVEAHHLDLDKPVPWSAMRLDHDPAWDSVTPRELLAHSSGMPVARNTWLNQPGSPRPQRGTWVYSNGNYCALGLLIQHVTGQHIDAAARSLVFDPLGLTAAHLTTDRPAPSDGPYVQGVGRLERLGGAGTWMASSDVVAAMVAAAQPPDMATLLFPGIMIDQYGWGHTGSVDGAKACVWRFDNGRTVVAAIVAGNRPGSGGQLCDLVVPALATDMGIWKGDPDRYPK
jgi:D-alanyl-D-alanine carboxypeptidase